MKRHIEGDTMYEVDFSKPIHIHFIGIGGISMSGLAEILLKESFTISGSDAKESDLTRHLTSLGAQVFYGQKAENILPGTDLVVYTAAIHPDNPEFAAAKAAGVPMLTRAELLGQIMRNYDTPIAVSGTHGKTTTTSMLSHILMAADCDPTISVGGILPSIGGNIRVGHSETFLTEACEYTNSFLSFFPKIGIILNMDADHLDFFKDKILLRPQEISNNPEVARRLGLIAINTALEADIFGNINSTHVSGTRMMNGIGGSGDFTRSAMLSIFTTPSTAKEGKISAFVPMVSHLDHSEHSVKIIITEYGVADLRGKSPIQRARCIIDNCVHPDYKPLLEEYLAMGIKGHTPQNLKCCFAFHEELAASGDMHNVDWSKYNK